MKVPSPKQNFIKIATTALCIAPLSNVCAVTTSVIQFVKQSGDTSIETKLDPFYNVLDAGGNFVSGDGNSTVFKGQVVLGGLTGDLSGRYYDSDPLRPGTYGLINSDLPWNRADVDTPEPGWLVRFGLRPDAEGVFTHTYGKGTPDEVVVPASYVSVRLQAEDTVVYDTAELVIEGTEGVTPTTVWAVASDENFTVIRAAEQTFTTDNGHTLRWTWTNLQIGSNGLELRIYGIIGADEGYFGVGTVTTTYEPPPPVPEPSAGLLGGLAALRLLMRRKRSR